MTRYFQINEDDLTELERSLPQLCEVHLIGHKLDNRLRTVIRRVQTILTNVRWNYGPHTDVEEIPAE